MNQKRHLVFILLPLLSITLFFGFFVCKNATKKVEEKKSEKLIENLQKPPSSFSDTLVIENATAVFYSPDSAQLKKIEAINKKMVFESMQHEYFYQMRNARMVLKKYWSKIKIIETSKYRYLLFKLKNKKVICIDLNTKNDICGIILFDKIKEPLQIDMMNIDTALGDYFKKNNF